MNKDIKLTQYSHGSGCGCKISPKDLRTILKTSEPFAAYPDLIIGNNDNDDAAVYALSKEQLIISTTDFFMPIVDDPFDFGAIASVNAISDIYAMAGKPLMALAILGWPLNKLSAEIANEVLQGARSVCKKAGIPLAGGHSIDSPEPIFGLAVTGSATPSTLRTNKGAQAGCQLYLTKPLGVGIMTTAQKKGILSPDDLLRVRNSMLTLNDIGRELGKIPGVKSLTDVTGFGLLGHLNEMCQASGVSAEIEYNAVPLLPELQKYVEQEAIPGGTMRNFKSYGHQVSQLTDQQRAILCDPQTSGGLLVAVSPEAQETFTKLMLSKNRDLQPIGSITAKKDKSIYVR